MYMITEYTVMQQYGGPEEGGWWYFDYQPTGRVIAADLEDKQAAYEQARKLNIEAKRLKQESGEQPCTSVVGTPDTEYYVETTFGEHQTTEIPFYE